jgi:hypothetical protein
MVTTDQHPSRSSPALVATTVALSALYLALVVRIVSRHGSALGNRGSFTSVLVAHLILYVVTVVGAVVWRRRDGALVPVCLAALFGSISSVVFFRL